METGEVRRFVPALAALILPAFLAGAGPQIKDAAGAPAPLAPIVEVTGAWFPNAVRFLGRTIQPAEGNRLLIVAVWAKNGKGKRLTVVDFKSPEDRTLTGLAVNWDNGVRLSSGTGQLVAAQGSPIEPLGVVVGGSMAFFKPRQTGLAREADLGDIPARFRDQPASLMLIFETPNNARGLRLKFGSGDPLPVEPLETRAAPPPAVP